MFLHKKQEIGGCWKFLHNAEFNTYTQRKTLLIIDVYYQTKKMNYAEHVARV
jgi:hypothetical protein